MAGLLPNLAALLTADWINRKRMNFLIIDYQYSGKYSQIQATGLGSAENKIGY
jgi:hypothetical protein